MHFRSVFATEAAHTMSISYKVLIKGFEGYLLALIKVLLVGKFNSIATFCNKRTNCSRTKMVLTVLLRTDKNIIFIYLGFI